MLAAGQVVHAFADRLSGLPTAGTNVFTDRNWPLADKDLPAWLVTGADEEVENQTVHGPAIELHTLNVKACGYTRAVAELDDAMNAMAAEGLTALFSITPPADALDGISRKLQMRLLRIERADAKVGEAAIGEITVTLQSQFRVKANAPETLF